MTKPLTNVDILKHIEKDPYARKTFIGVYAKDKLPSIQSYPCSLVVNTDPSTKPGQHWLAIYFGKDKSSEIFDSFGLHPEQYDLVKYLTKYSKEYDFNKTRLQDLDSAACGHYCIFYILLKSRCFSLNEILSLFHKFDFKVNDFMVEHIVFD